MREMAENGEVDALVPERVWQELARGLMERAAFAHVRGAARVRRRFPRILPEMELLYEEPGRGRGVHAPSRSCRGRRTRSWRCASRVLARSCDPLADRVARGAAQAAGCVPGPRAARRAPREPDRWTRRSSMPRSCWSCSIQRMPGAGRSGSPNWSTPRSWASRTRPPCARTARGGAARGRRASTPARSRGRRRRRPRYARASTARGWRRSAPPWTMRDGDA